MKYAVTKKLNLSPITCFSSFHEIIPSVILKFCMNIIYYSIFKKKETSNYTINKTLLYVE